MSNLRALVAAQVFLATASLQVQADPGASTFALRDGEVLRLELVQDGSDIQPVVVATTGLPGSAVSLTVGTDRHLYGDYRDGTTARSLVRIDPDTGEAQLIGDLVASVGGSGIPPSASSDMTTLADGTILLMDNPFGAISSVDPETAELTVLADAPAELRTLGEFGGVLHGIVEEQPKYPTYALASLDLASGTASPLASLEGIECESGNCRISTAMAFDSAGGLWVNVLALVGVGVPDEQTYFYYYPAPETGQLAAVSEVLPRVFRAGMVVVEPRPPAVEIPTLQGVGLAVLAWVLAVVAVGRVGLRR